MKPLLILSPAPPWQRLPVLQTQVVIFERHPSTEEACGPLLLLLPLPLLLLLLLLLRLLLPKQVLLHQLLALGWQPNLALREFADKQELQQQKVQSTLVSPVELPQPTLVSPVELSPAGLLRR